MLLFLSLLGIFLSGLLVYFNAGKNPASVFMGLLFFLISIYAFIDYILFYSESAVFISIVFVNFAFISYLIGPALYWYVRSIIKDDHRLKKTDFWHLLPMLIFLFTALPYTFSPYSLKVEMANQIILDVGFIQNHHSTILYKWIGVPAVFLSRPVLILAYILWSALLVIRFVREKSNSTVFTRQGFMLKWISLLLGFFLILVISHTLLIVKATFERSLVIFYTLNILQILSAISLIGLLISPFLFPEILYGLPRFPEKVLSKISEDYESDRADAASNKRQIKLEDEYISEIGRKADLCMSELRPYLQPECNIAYISKLIKIPVHHLGYYFREIKKRHFNDYRNEWRVRHAKKLISEGKVDEMTLEAIGKLSGFSSRSAFLVAFKKAEGQTPNAFTHTNIS
jgi:AraC-like DNA-binding protein